MKNYWVVFSVLLAGSIILAPIHNNLLAQPKTTNPLEIEIDKSDRVIPLGYKKRELSTFEINRIKREMDRLDRNAKQELQQGEGDTAFELWYRQLRLARAVGIKTEIAALGEAGEIAWQANRGEDLRNIANRLKTIESQIEIESTSDELLEQFAKAYQQVRYIEQAIAIYQQILQSNKARANSAAVELNLKTLGELYLAQFNYPEAAETYEELLALTQSKSQVDSEIDSYLQTLVDIYDRTEQTKSAIATKKRLIQSYTAAEKTAKLASIELAIAFDYEALNQTQEAVAAYDRAFTLASAERQLAIANDALEGLGKLYQKEGEGERAIATLNRLLDVQRESYNYYGLVNTYDMLGKMYLKSAQTKVAKKYFQQALELAKTLNYKVSYFNNQIKKL